MLAMEDFGATSVYDVLEARALDAPASADPADCRAMRGFRPRDVVHIAREAAKGLAFVHSMGYIHGDIKTDNILVDECVTARASPRPTSWRCTLCRPGAGAPHALAACVLGVWPWRMPQQKPRCGQVM